MLHALVLIGVAAVEAHQTRPAFRAGGAAGHRELSGALRLRGGSFEDDARLSWNMLQAASLGSLIGVERILAGRPVRDEDDEPRSDGRRSLHWRGEVDVG